MPRRLNYTNRKKILRNDVSIRLDDSASLTFELGIRLEGYDFDRISPPPRVFVEAYRGSSAQWKRFDLGLIGELNLPFHGSLVEFGVPDGMLFRVKVSACEAGDSLGRLVAEADSLRAMNPDEYEMPRLPLIEHVTADDIGDEVWRIDFDGVLPLLKVNAGIPGGAEQFVTDPRYRAVFGCAVIRQVLTRVLIIEEDEGDVENEDDWRQRWIRFARELPGMTFEDDPGELNEPLAKEQWIDQAVEAFAAQSGLLPTLVEAIDKEVTQ